MCPFKKLTIQVESASGEIQTREITPLIEKVLTAEEQAALTPDLVIQSLKEGNQRFVEGELTARDHTKQIRKTVDGQFPKAVIL
jgi:carbonic anhydrase